LGTTTVPEEDPVPALPEVDPADAPEVEPADAPEVEPADAPEVDPVDAPEVEPEADPVDAPEVEPATALPEVEPATALPEVEPATALPESALPEVAPEVSTTPDVEPDCVAPDVAPAEAPVAPMSPEPAGPPELATPELGWINPASLSGAIEFWSPVAHAETTPLAPKRQTPPICVIAHRRMTYLESAERMVVGAHTQASAPLGKPANDMRIHHSRGFRSPGRMDPLPRKGRLR
jgi:hypothetical protein